MIVVVTAVGLVLSQGAPAGTVFDNPVKQGLFEANVMSHFFTFDPFMTKNLGSFGQKLLIKCRFVEHIIVLLCG